MFRTFRAHLVEGATAGPLIARTGGRTSWETSAEKNNFAGVL